MVKSPLNSCLLALQLSLTTFRAQHHHLTIWRLSREDLPVIESSLTRRTPKTFVVPFTSQCADVLPNDRLFTHFALWSTSLGSFCLAIDAPCVAVLLNVGHSSLKGIAAFGTEEMPIMPMLAQRHNMLAKNGCFAMLATRCKELMPVEMTIETQSLVSVLSHSLARGFIENLAGSTPADALQPGGTI